MKVIKLDAIDSTNDYLKSLCTQSKLENFTVVCAKNQTNGRGQMGAKWQTQLGKNLIMSILIHDVLENYESIFHLNVAVALAILETLETYKIADLSIKWPNDIMSANKKIAGILIENSFKADNSIQSIVGIGLNVNQNTFVNLPKATSMKVVSNADFDLDLILETLVNRIEANCKKIQIKHSDELWNRYHKKLFKINIPMPFEDEKHNRFMAIIQGVTFDGKLQLILEDDTVKTYVIKEIQLLY